MDFNSCHKAKVQDQNSNLGDMSGPRNVILVSHDFRLSVQISFAYAFCYSVKTWSSIISVLVKNTVYF